MVKKIKYTNKDKKKMVLNWFVKKKIKKLHNIKIKLPKICNGF